MSATGPGGGNVLGYRSSEPNKVPSPSCTRCGSKMIRGVICPTGVGPYSTDGHFWIEGEPRRNWLGMLKMPKGKLWEIATFRCPSCGFLEQYAPPG